MHWTSCCIRRKCEPLIMCWWAIRKVYIQAPVLNLKTNIGNHCFNLYLFIFLSFFCHRKALQFLGLFVLTILNLQFATNLGLKKLFSVVCCNLIDFVPNALFLYPPENIRKPYGFLFSGGRERVHWVQMG